MYYSRKVYILGKSTICRNINPKIPTALEMDIQTASNSNAVAMPEESLVRRQLPFLYVPMFPSLINQSAGTPQRLK